jgi:hypothetical protein
MRHSTIVLTMDTYGHLLPGQESETISRLPRMMPIFPSRWQPLLRHYARCGLPLERRRGNGYKWTRSDR